MSLREHLEKRKKAGLIDFMEINLDYGRSYHEYIGYSFEHKDFFRLFYDNKYRQDKIYPDKFLESIQKKLDYYKEGINDCGVYNTRDSYEKVKKQVDFINKYL